jgi:hypothetical protein
VWAKVPKSNSTSMEWSWRRKLEVKWKWIGAGFYNQFVNEVGVKVKIMLVEVEKKFSKIWYSTVDSFKFLKNKSTCD